MKYKFEIYKSTEIIFKSTRNLDFGKNTVFVIDRNIYNLNSYLEKHSDYALIIDSKEKNKNYQSLSEILDFFLENKVNRSFNIVVIGGGVLSDFVAFATSIFMRGCNLFLIPTTLLAMVDAGLGGKTAIHFNGKKNILGSFYPASKVFIDFSFLKTLPNKEIENGWSEIIKIALISKSNLRNLIVQNENLNEIISQSIQIKMEICEKDILDNNERRFLNFGHTFAHMIESYFHFSVSHGQAVAIGIRIAVFFAEYFLNISYDKDVSFLLNKLPEYSLNLSGMSREILMEFIFADKKNTDKLNIVLIKKIGEPFVYSIKNIDNIIFAMNNYNSR
jgi:3-dehydroquinate synthase